MCGRTKRRFGVLIALVASLTTVAVVSVVLADEPTPSEHDERAEKDAAAHFAEGERAFSRGDFAKAGESFELAYGDKPHEAALWNAARSWERGGELARAANLYRRYLRTAPDSAPDKKRAATALEALMAKLGRIEIVAVGLDSFAVDGRAVSDVVVFVTPGAHLVEGKLVGSDGASARRGTIVEAGARQSVLLEAPSSSPSAAPVPSSAPSMSSAPVSSAAPASSRPSIPPKVDAKESHHGTTPWLLAPFVGVTATSAAFLVASGIDVLRARSDYDELKNGRSAEDQQQLIDQGRGKTDRTNALVGVTAGLAVATTFVAIFAIDWQRPPKSPPARSSEPSRPSARVLVGPGKASFEARF